MSINTSDRIFTGFFELPVIGKLPGIQPNLPVNSGKCMKMSKVYFFGNFFDLGVCVMHQIEAY